MFGAGAVVDTLLTCLNVFFFLQFSPYVYPRIVAPSLPHNPANQPPNRLVLPAEAPSGATPRANTLQPVQQQQVSPA